MKTKQVSDCRMDVTYQTCPGGFKFRYEFQIPGPGYGLPVKKGLRIRNRLLKRVVNMSFANKSSGEEMGKILFRNSEIVAKRKSHQQEQPTHEQLSLC